MIFTLLLCVASAEWARLNGSDKNDFNAFYKVDACWPVLKSDGTPEKYERVIRLDEKTVSMEVHSVEDSDCTKTPSVYVSYNAEYYNDLNSIIDDTLYFMKIWPSFKCDSNDEYLIYTFKKEGCNSGKGPKGDVSLYLKGDYEKKEFEYGTCDKSKLGKMKDDECSSGMKAFFGQDYENNVQPLGILLVFGILLLFC